MSDRRRPSPRGILFVALTAGLIGIAYTAAVAGVWAIAVAAAAIAAWMGDLAAGDLGLRRRRTR
jgi:hypothetical protein